MPKYPQVKVRLVGQDGNAFVILYRCQDIARKKGLKESEIEDFLREAASSDYDHLLRTCTEWFSIS